MNISTNILDFIINKAIIVPGLLIAITFHELAHGYSAYIMGDPTAKQNGRLTLNPIAHIDVVGFLLLFTVGFGWAKPVPINPSYFKKRKIGTILVSIAGPLTNFIIGGLVIVIFLTGLVENNTLLKILFFTFIYNGILGVFNLLPFPPLDGSKIIASLLPIKYEALFYRYEKYLYFILIALIITNSIDMILDPVVTGLYELITKVIYLSY